MLLVVGNGHGLNGPLGLCVMGGNVRKLGGGKRSLLSLFSQMMRELYL